MATKTGIVEITLLIIHTCRVWNKYSAKVTAAINAAATSGLITTSQRDNALLSLSGLSVLCSVLRLVTGY